jgi:hypothetical protein
MNQRASTEPSITFSGFFPAGLCNGYYLHFLPLEERRSGGLSAVSVTIEVFCSESDRDQVTLTGARFSNPDGVRLIDAFPLWFTTKQTSQEAASPHLPKMSVLRPQQVGGAQSDELGEPSFSKDEHFGVSITIRAEQPSLRVTPSICVLEWRGTERMGSRLPTQYLLQAPQSSSDRKRLVVPIVQDAQVGQSLLLVNPRSIPYSPQFVWQDSERPVFVEAVPPWSVREISIDLEQGRDAVPAVETSWGSARVRTMEAAGEDVPVGAGLFLVSRTLQGGVASRGRYLQAQQVVSVTAL